MPWRDVLSEDEKRRLDQIESYESAIGGGYKVGGDQFLISQMARIFDRQEASFNEFRKKYTPWWVRLIARRPRHRYSCRLFRRIDQLILLLFFKRPHWDNGSLVIGYCEAPTFFPRSWYAWASDVQNKHYWTQLFLDA